MSLLKEFLDRVVMIQNPPSPREVNILMTLHESGDGGKMLETDQVSCQRLLTQRVRDLPIAEKYRVRVMERWSFTGGWQKDYSTWKIVQRFEIPISNPNPVEEKELVTSDTL